ncbi:MAG: GNAT family N-acetyltransferase [Bacteroidales bacterium]
MNKGENIVITVANASHMKYTQEINDTIDLASKARGTGIARRTDEYINKKLKEGKAIIALDGDKFVGFNYIETWEHKKFVANSGLIVKKEYRGLGLAKRIKQASFNLSRQLYPNSKIFGLTTGLAVMKINYELGYRPVTFSELTDDEAFWKGCKSCVNYDVLSRTNKTRCLCTGMLYDPAWEKEFPIHMVKKMNSNSLDKKNIILRTGRKMFSAFIHH